MPGKKTGVSIMSVDLQKISSQQTAYEPQAVPQATAEKPDAKYTPVSPSNPKTHLTITIDKTTAAVGGTVGGLLLFGHVNMAVGTMLAANASLADKRFSFNVPTVLGATAALSVSNALLGPTFTFLIGLGATCLTVKKIASADPDKVGQNILKLHDPLLKILNSAKETFEKKIDAVAKDLNFSWQSIKNDAAPSFFRAKRDIERELNRLSKEAGYNWKDIKTGVSEIAAQVSSVAQELKSAASDAANVVFRETGAAVESVKTAFANMHEASPVWEKIEIRNGDYDSEINDFESEIESFDNDFIPHSYTKNYFYQYYWRP